MIGPGVGWRGIPQTDNLRRPVKILKIGVTIQLVPPAALPGAKLLKSLINRFKKMIFQIVRELMADVI